MCILGLILNLHPDLPFICAHNRDEYLSRPVEPPHADQEIICGKDVRGGGTWLGFNRKTGIFVALTNVRSKIAVASTSPKAASRGTLVMNLLKMPMDATEEGSQTVGEEPQLSLINIRNAADGKSCITTNILSSSSSVPTDDPLTTTTTHQNTTLLDLGHEYGPCNVVIALLGHRHGTENIESFFFSNAPSANLSSTGAATATSTTSNTFNLRYGHVQRISPSGSSPRSTSSSSSVHALSNGGFDDESWLKVKWLRQQLQQLHASSNTIPTLAELAPRYGLAPHNIGSEMAAVNTIPTPTSPTTHTTPTPTASSTTTTSSSSPSLAVSSTLPTSISSTIPVAFFSSDPTLTTHLRNTLHHQKSHSVTKSAIELEAALVEAALHKVVPIFTFQHPLTSSEESIIANAEGAGTSSQKQEASLLSSSSSSSSMDLSWSPLPAPMEQKLQQHVFLPRMPQHDYGTRALTIVLQVGAHVVYYCYSSFDPESPIYVPKDAVAVVSAHEAEHLMATAGGGVGGAASDKSATTTTTTTTGAIHDSVASADVTALHESITEAAKKGGMAVAEEMVNLKAANTTGTEKGVRKSISIAGSSSSSFPSHDDGQKKPEQVVTVAGLKWLIFRCPIVGK